MCDEYVSADECGAKGGDRKSREEGEPGRPSPQDDGEQLR